MRLLAHRGSPGTTSVENTVPAVAACLEAGADGIEVDLRLSADGVLVVCHDRDLQRLAGSPLALATSRWGDLRAAADVAGVPLARLEDVLALTGGHAVVLEVKAPPPSPGAVAAVTDALRLQLARLRADGLASDLTVSSFSPEVVACVRASAVPLLGVRTALLGRESLRPTALLRRALAGGHDEIHPYVSALVAEPGCVEAAHRVGLRVVPWTVNADRDVRRLAALGVDAVITDVPERAGRVLAARRLSAA